MEDLNRAFFSHASHVYSLVADGIEMAKAESAHDVYCCSYSWRDPPHISDNWWQLGNIYYIQSAPIW